MTEQSPPNRPRSRAKSGSKAFLAILAVVIILAGIGGFLYLRQPSLQGDASSRPQDNVNPPTSRTDAGDPQSPNNPSLQSGAASNATIAASGGAEPKLPSSETSSDSTAVSSTDGAFSQKDGLPGNGGRVESLSGEPLTSQHDQPASAEEYQHLITELNTFYTHLDQQPYMQAFGLQEPSKAHFSKLLQKLIDNPPVVTRETDDLLTLLKNTAHFFRILDKENIIVLKGILDREKKSFEQILKTFYQLTYKPEYLQKEYGLELPLETLHDYAAFFLNTIGGRLYLFRRDSASRMTISYYSILVIDRANQEGNSRLGIDLRPAIDSLIEEIDNTGKNLRFKEEYLDKLYDLKEKYN